MASITNELRMYVGLSDGAVQRSIRAIADRIDTEYEKAIRELNKLAESSVLLPVDADGAPIHVGDLMESNMEMFKVGRMLLTKWGWAIDGGKYTTDEIRHHAPNVEELLGEFGISWECADDGEDKTAVLKEYAAKLRAIIEGSKGPEWQETDSQDEGR